MKLIRALALSLVVSSFAIAQTYSLAPVAKQQLLDANGVPLAGGLLYTYAAGTSTPLATYSNSTGTANTNPIVLDSGGFASIWLGTAAYKIVAQNSSGVQQWSVDNIVTTGAQIASNTGQLTSITGGNGANFLNYTAPATGAVSRTIASKFSDMASVKDYGALGNGTTDDTVAIQKCFDAQGPSAGACYFPPAVYIITRLKMWSAAGPYNGFSVVGAGAGATVLRTKPGVSPTAAVGENYATELYYNCLEVMNPDDLSGTALGYDQSISNLTCDGNRANINAPPTSGTNFDDTHNGIISAGSVRLKIQGVTVKNYYFLGVSMGLFTSYAHADFHSENNGYGTLGYGAVQVAGSSHHNTLNVTSNGDVLGVWLANNAWYNTVNATISGSLAQAVTLNAALNSMTYGNVVNAIASGCATGLSMGSGSGATNTYENTVTMVIDGATWYQAVIVAYTALYNHLNLTVRHANVDAVELYGSDNDLNLIGVENSFSAAGAYWGLVAYPGALRNRITATLTDAQATPTQTLAIRFSPGANYNQVFASMNPAAAQIQDLGTGNVIRSVNNGTASDSMVVTLPNNGNIFAKDSTNVARSMFLVSPTNNIYFADWNNNLTGGFVYYGANTQHRFYVNNVETFDVNAGGVLLPNAGVFNSKSSTGVTIPLLTLSGANNFYLGDYTNVQAGAFQSYSSNTQHRFYVNAVETFDVNAGAVTVTGASTTFTVPSIKSTTGARYVCVDTAGKLVSQAAACSGT